MVKRLLFQKIQETKQGLKDIGEESWATLNKLDQFSMESRNVFTNNESDIKTPFAEPGILSKKPFQLIMPGNWERISMNILSGRLSLSKKHLDEKWPKKSKA